MVELLTSQLSSSENIIQTHAAVPRRTSHADVSCSNVSIAISQKHKRVSVSFVSLKSESSLNFDI